VPKLAEALYSLKIEGTWADPGLADKFRIKTLEHKGELATHNY
jgi:hypothetical protein